MALLSVLCLYFLMSLCLTPFCLHQENESKVLALERRLAELKAENKPLDFVLKQTIQAVCAEEVGFV